MTTARNIADVLDELCELVRHQLDVKTYLAVCDISGEIEEIISALQREGIRARTAELAWKQHCKETESLRAFQQEVMR